MADQAIPQLGETQRYYLRNALSDSYDAGRASGDSVPSIRALERRGLVCITRQGSGPRQRGYANFELTAEGRRVAELLRAEFEASSG